MFNFPPPSGTSSIARKAMEKANNPETPPEKRQRALFAYIVCLAIAVFLLLPIYAAIIFGVLTHFGPLQIVFITVGLVVVIFWSVREVKMWRGMLVQLPKVKQEPLVIRFESFPKSNGPQIAGVIAAYTGIYDAAGLLENLPAEFEVRADAFADLKSQLERLGCN